MEPSPRKTFKKLLNASKDSRNPLLILVNESIQWNQVLEKPLTMYSMHLKILETRESKTKEGCNRTPVFHFCQRIYMLRESFDVD